MRHSRSAAPLPKQPSASRTGNSAAAATAEASASGAVKAMPEIEGFLIRLIDLPGIAEVERIAAQPGAGWREDDPERVALVDRVSVSLFGITEGDTERPEPRIEDGLDARQLADYERLGPQIVRNWREVDAAYQRRVEEWHAWESNFEVLYDENLADEDRERFWQVLGVDVDDAEGNELASLHSFSRQLIVVARGLLPGAKLTPDGTGQRASPDAETWGRALEAAAKAFKERRS